MGFFCSIGMDFYGRSVPIVNIGSFQFCINCLKYLKKYKPRQETVGISIAFKMELY